MMIRFGINNILYLLLSTTLVVEIALGISKTEVSKVNQDKNSFMPFYNKVTKEPEVLEKELIGMLDSIYREQGGEPENRKGVLVPQLSGTHVAVLPPDPDNAALLYYQSFLLCPKPDAYTRESIYKALRGTEPDEKVRKYLNLQSCRETIKLIEAATQIPVCNWGIPYSQGLGVRLPQAVQLNSLSQLLSVDARTLATDGHYRAALGRCLTIRRLASHVSDDTVLLYAISLRIDGTAQHCIQVILGFMPPDAEILTWLQGQLDTMKVSLANSLKIDFELALQTMCTSPRILASVKDELTDKTKDRSDKKKVQSLTDEEIVARAREPYANFLNSALRAINSEMPYEEKYSELQRLTDNLEEEFGSDPAASQIISACSGQVAKLYGLYIRHTADINALRAAIEIYLAIAKTGQLPETLPDYMPKEPYSGEDYEYETTKEGFVLRCRVKPIDERELRQYEFKIKK